MRKISSSVSDEDLKNVLDGEKMLNVAFNGINVPCACSVEDKEIVSSHCA